LAAIEAKELVEGLRVVSAPLAVRRYRSIDR
jgi:hypothetical protein